MECEHCKLVLKSKYILKAHLANNKSCLKKRGMKIDSKFICCGCDSVFINNINLVSHFDICKKYIVIKIKEEYEIKLKEQKSNYEKIIKDLQSQNDKLFTTIENLAAKAIERPTTNNVTTTNIRANFSDKYLLENIKEEDVKMKFRNYLTEETFMGGQRSIAKLCTDHIIKTKDKKVLLACTDVSRKKFKYIDESGNLKEDHDARIFTEKVSKPIKAISRDVYDSILFDVKSEKETLDQDDYSRKAFLNDKELSAIDSYVKITCFDDPDHNNDFKNELAILNK